MRWMWEAWDQVGVVETAGAAATPEIVRFFHDAGRPDITSDEVPWCAAFVGACLKRAGVPLMVPQSERLLARGYLKQGTPIDEPRVGAIAIFKRTGDPRFGHVGFVNGVTDTHMHLLGGNQSNSVSIQAYPRADLIGLRWPEPPAKPADLVADGSRIAQASQRQLRDGAKTGAVSLPPSPPKLEPEALAQKMTGAKGIFETAEAFVQFGVSKWPWIVGGLAAFWFGRMAWDAWQIRQARLEDHNTGKTLSLAPSGADKAPGASYDAAADRDAPDAQWASEGANNMTFPEAVR